MKTSFNALPKYLQSNSILIQYLKIHFNIIHPYSHRSSECTLSFSFPNQKSIQDYFHSHACHNPNPFCDCSLIPQYLTGSANYETPQNAFFSAHSLSSLSHHSVLKHNELINGKKHSQVLKAIFHVIHSIHLLTIHM